MHNRFILLEKWNIDNGEWKIREKKIENLSN